MAILDRQKVARDRPSRAFLVQSFAAIGGSPRLTSGGLAVVLGRNDSVEVERLDPPQAGKPASGG